MTNFGTGVGALDDVQGFLCGLAWLRPALGEATALGRTLGARRSAIAARAVTTALRKADL